MRMERVGRLLSTRRYRQCRALFAQPLQAHLALSGLKKGPFELEFRQGGRLAFPPFRKVRSMWRFLLEDPQRVASLRVEDGVIRFGFDGSTFGVRPDSYDYPIFSEIFEHDVYRLAQLPRPIGTVIDLGCNVGFFSARVAQQGAARVIALEPVARNRELAQRNLQGAGVADQVELLPYACAGTSGQTVRMHLSRDNTGAHSMDGAMAGIEGEAGAEEAETISLADLFERHQIDRCAFLKVDIEGAEFDVLMNAPIEVLQRVDRLACEVHVPVDAEDPLPALRDRLVEAGLRLEEEPGHVFMHRLRLRNLYGIRDTP